MDITSNIKEMEMKWGMVNINEICRPRQWKTLSMEKLKTVGFPVYGANGKIGYYDEFSHEYPTLAITCRGATCGSVHITEPKSYINGNAMALDNISENIDIKFLYYYFLQRGFIDVISGSAQPQITGEGLSKVKIPLPPLPVQKRIADILDAADALRRKDQELLKKYDELAQAIFIDMFGDPVRNEKGWEVKTISRFGKISTGNTPSRAEAKNYDTNYIEWIKTDNIKENNMIISSAGEYLSEIGAQKGRITTAGSLLVACIAGSIDSIGRAALTNRDVSFNQQINAIEPNENVNSLFLYFLIKYCRKHIQHHASNGMKRILSKGEFEKIQLILPNLSIQNAFVQKINLFINQKDKMEFACLKSENLFQTLIQKAFKGEL